MPYYAELWCEWAAYGTDVQLGEIVIAVFAEDERNF